MRHLSLVLLTLFFSMTANSATLTYTGSTITGISQLEIAGGSLYDVSFADGNSDTVFGGITFDEAYRVKADAVSLAMFTFLRDNAASGNDIRGCGLDVNNCTLFNADRVNFPPINVGSLYIDTFAVVYYSPDCGPGCEGWANQGAQGLSLNYDTASSGNITLVTFTPSPVPADFTLKSSTVTGCKSVVGTVKLDTPAPAGGVLFTLSDTLTAATMPATVTVPEGALSKTFTVKTSAVETAESGTVSATLGSQTLNQDLTLKPIGMKSVTLTPTSVVGGTQVVGKANLECKAGPGPILVDLESSNAAVASPIAASISVEQGMLSANFDVTTNAVQAKSFATISGTANGVNKSKKLTVNVAATVSPTSLKFGSVAVGTTHVLNATLTNKGAEAFAVSSISPTGSNATYYSQTNNCPANLAAGASCTIEVSFNPTVAGSKSAKLSIATSASSTPLSVSLSGTGI